MKKWKNDSQQKWKTSWSGKVVLGKNHTNRFKALSPGIWRRFTNGNTWEIPVGILQRLGIFSVLFFFQRSQHCLAWNASNLHRAGQSIATSTRPQKPQKVAEVGEILFFSGKSRLMKYYNLARTRCVFLLKNIVTAICLGKMTEANFWLPQIFFWQSGASKNWVVI